MRLRNLGTGTRAAHAAGKPVAIASDASQMAIDGYLKRHAMASLVTAVGRYNFAPRTFNPRHGRPNSPRRI
jgi:hypothetical protein